MTKRNVQSISQDDLQTGDFIRIRVPNVKVNDGVLSVKFVARPKHVTCSVRGQPKIRVTFNGKKFVAENRLTGEALSGNTPAKAFARAASSFWN